jgi:hypothetical protein
LFAVALCVLDGLGDQQAGQWTERGVKAFHLRRRLSASEQKLAGNLAELDIRGSAEYGVRRAAMQRFLPPQLADWQE